jgi:hypothetical protein
MLYWSGGHRVVATVRSINSNGSKELKPINFQFCINPLKYQNETLISQAKGMYLFLDHALAKEKLIWQKDPPGAQLSYQQWSSAPDLSSQAMPRR